MNLDKYITISKLDGFMFTCPICEQVVVKSLSKTQIQQLAETHLISCKKKAKDKKAKGAE